MPRPLCCGQQLAQVPVLGPGPGYSPRHFSWPPPAQGRVRKRLMPFRFEGQPPAQLEGADVLRDPLGALPCSGCGSGAGLRRYSSTCRGVPALWAPDLTVSSPLPSATRAGQPAPAVFDVFDSQGDLASVGYTVVIEGDVGLAGEGLQGGVAGASVSDLLM